MILRNCVTPARHRANRRHRANLLLYRRNGLEMRFAPLRKSRANILLYRRKSPVSFVLISGHTHSQ
jgi:hypothetical protein